MTREQHENLFRLARELYGALKDYGVTPEFLAGPRMLVNFAYRPGTSGELSPPQQESLFVTWDCGTMLKLTPPEMK